MAFYYFVIKNRFEQDTGFYWFVLFIFSNEIKAIDFKLYY